MSKPRTFGVRLNPALTSALERAAGEAGVAPTTLARNLVAQALIRQHQRRPAPAAPEPESSRCRHCRGNGYISYERVVADAGAARRNVTRYFARRCFCQRQA